MVAPVSLKARHLQETAGMKKTVAALVAVATIAGSLVSVAPAARAGDGVAAGVAAGLIGGAIVGVFSFMPN